MSDTPIREMIEIAYASKNRDAQIIARRIESNLNQGVTPSPKALKMLNSHFNVLNACNRLLDDGRCDGWLRKHAAEEGIPTRIPYICPFASSEKQASKFSECPGYKAPVF